MRVKPRDLRLASYLPAAYALTRECSGFGQNYEGMTARRNSSGKLTCVGLDTAGTPIR